MKRFITYLYEYERGNKSKNIGFIRINIREEKTEMQLVIRNCLQDNARGKVFALINRKNLLGIELGEIKIINGQSDSRTIFATNNIMDCGYAVNEIVGIAIRLEGGEYFASCWKDELAEEIARAEISLEEEEKKENMNVETQLTAAEEYPPYEPAVESEKETWKTGTDRDVSYEKIDITQIRDLPSPNWHFATNSFLVHGFANYGYLVLKKEMERDKETLSLGVPGIFEKPEAVMAILFGFPDFEALPQEVAEIEMNVERSVPYKEKNQEPRVGLFGCWFVNLKN